MIDSILIRPLAYPHAEALVGVWHTAPGLPGVPDSIGCSPSMYFTYREENRTFQQFGVWNSGGASVTGIAEPEVPRALFVTYGVLDAVGVKPLLGRWFSPADDTPGSPETVILTYGYWQRRFGGDTIHRRADDDHQFEAAHGDRRDAGGIPLSARSRADSSSAIRTQHSNSWDHSAPRGLRGSSPASRWRRPTRMWPACWESG